MPLNQPPNFNKISNRGPIRYRVNVISANYTIRKKEYYILVDTVPITITWPNLQLVRGRTLIIKDITGNANANNITINTGTAKIDGANQVKIVKNYGVKRLFCDGTDLFTW